MKIYRTLKTLLFLLLCTATVSAGYRVHGAHQQSDQLDPMIDFAYPVSSIQSVRQDLNQALYFSQQDDLESVVSLLQGALSKLVTRAHIEDDDKEYMQQIINQIDTLIASLENQGRAGDILDLCQQLNDRI